MQGKATTPEKTLGERTVKKPERYSGAKRTTQRPSEEWSSLEDIPQSFSSLLKDKQAQRVSSSGAGVGRFSHLGGGHRLNKN